MARGARTAALHLSPFPAAEPLRLGICHGEGTPPETVASCPPETGLTRYGLLVAFITVKKSAG
ncbi:hypothetical protein SAMN05443572_1021025 [Myxococcus fulvus]|uniref:Uncharacterized protein n=1 Tax=Myxococcus fulvus TaxID=33 RepID=A0A511SVB8_MYXFU|nr:hypothetical protein MFU01_08910 [Myxococcus fulvus]SET65306.1 hypothetical protein SAMN05443572_1021025 [Myxococcus fulvus]